MKLLHPSTAKLTQWLEHGDLADLDDHLATCQRCANRLEELAPAHGDLRVALAGALDAPTDLVPRLQVGVRKQVEARQELGLLGQMLGLPWQTTKLLMDDERP